MRVIVDAVEEFCRDMQRDMSKYPSKYSEGYVDACKHILNIVQYGRDTKIELDSSLELRIEAEQAA